MMNIILLVLAAVNVTLAVIDKNWTASLGWLAVAVLSLSSFIKDRYLDNE